MRGGRRTGAGRKNGSKSRRTQEVAAAAVASGETPLEYMLRVMRDEGADTRRRDAMAQSAAPFIHPRLAAVEHSGNDEKPVSLLIASGVPRELDEQEASQINGHHTGH